MILRALALENWMSFRGTTRLEGLGPRSYAVTARHVDDADRSNGFGKSGFVESILFGLKGWTNPDRAFKADEWITDGEKSGSVYQEFDDGYWVKRSRAGKSWNLETSTGAKKEEAQREIDQRIALSIDDALATTFFRQRDMARFVLARPEPRMEVVSEWLRLGPLERCEERARERMRKVEAEAASVLHDVRVAEEVEQRELSGRTLDDLVAEKDTASKALDAATAKREQTRIAWQTSLNAVAAREKLEEYDQLTEEGHALRKRVDVATVQKLLSEHHALEKQAKEALQVVGDAKRDLEQKQRLTLGQFDGRCPVANIACPAKDAINTPRAQNETLATQARRRHDVAMGEWQKVDAAERAARARLQEVERLQDRFDAMKKRALSIKDVAEAARKSNDGDVEHTQALELHLRDDEESCQRLATQVEILARSIRAVEQSRVQRARFAEVARQHEARMRTAREGTMLFGRNGAQRRIGERTLALIERNANASLASCEVDLRVELRWSREGNGLAKACDACGRPYPPSQKVKTCESCGHARGPHLVHKLDLLLSAQGGAYEDLAGYAIQLAAGQWLRADRGSPLAVAVLDEPTGAMDPAVRRAFVSRLPSMLSASGVRQSFCISHSADVLTSLPGRIEIVSDGQFAKAHLVAA